MRSRYNIYFFYLFISVHIIACKKLIEVDPPKTQLVSASVYSSNASAAAVVTSIYDNLMFADQGLSGGTGSISLRMGLSADELINYSNDPVLSQFYINALTSSPNSYFWNEIFKYIYVSNAAIEGISSSTGITDLTKQQLVGEAKFIRAFLHFYALNLFGDIPLVISTDYKKNNILTRTNITKVYAQIVADLKDAQNLLSDNYLKPTGAITNERIRPNKGAATALLARVYLYVGDWYNAEMQATSVIKASSYNLLPNLNEVFLANSKETIWQLQPVNPIYNTYDGYRFILTSMPNSNFPTAISSNLLNAFEIGDNRPNNWINTYNGFYYPYKYKVKGGIAGTPVTEYLMVLRLAEQFLIRAESRAQLGNISGAQSDLNVIRMRASLTNTSANDKASLLPAILHERQVELFTEWGHRWFDLKRTGTIDAVMSVVAPQKGGSWNSNWQLLPIPQSEILINSNLVQNVGY